MVNEGNFGQGNASISYTNPVLSEVKNNAFSDVNDMALGDQAQSIGFSGENAYIVVTGSQKIEVVNRETLERELTVSSGLLNPRYFRKEIDSSTALVTCWGDTTDENRMIIWAIFQPQWRQRKVTRTKFPCSAWVQEKNWSKW